MLYFFSPENTTRSDEECYIDHTLRKDRPLRQSTSLQISMIRNIAFSIDVRSHSRASPVGRVCYKNSVLRYTSPLKKNMKLNHDKD